jgi:hypothetical protein
VVSCCGLWLLLFTAVMGRVHVGIQDGVFGSFLFFALLLELLLYSRSDTAILYW